MRINRVQDAGVFRLLNVRASRTGASRALNALPCNALPQTFSHLAERPMKRTAWFVVVGALTTMPVNAAPPDGANPIFSEYYKGLVTKEGWGCCSIADCRPVRVKVIDKRPWVFIDKESFGSTAPDDWVQVPENAYGTKNTAKDPVRPAGSVACWYNGGIRCFDWPLTEG